MKKNIPTWLKDLALAFIASLVLGALIAAFCPGLFWQSALAAALISLITSLLLIRLWRAFGPSKSLAIMMVTTFLLRIAVAVFISQALPAYGYDNPVNNAGYLYSDAFGRDQAAYKLATSNESLFTPFLKPDITDQYGGLLFMSASLYRLLSPDAARPLLISLLAAFSMTAGLAFLWSAIRKRWAARIALIACWIYALYPDSILLGSSQMREPFLIALGCIAFWAALQWRDKPIRAGLISLLALAAACLFSVPAGLVFAAILTTMVILEWTLSQQRKSLRLLGLGVLAVLAVCALTAGWYWLKNTLYFDAYTTKTSSGWITSLIEKYGEGWNIPFVTIYGLSQPVLPAAFFEPSIPIWIAIAIFRGLGWYCVIPFMIYGFFAILKTTKESSHWLLAMIFIVFLLWMVVSSARAGGDQWDNPRYRFILLPFLALIVAWVWDHIIQTRSPWFWRWIAIEVEFLLFFVNFYWNRYIGGINTYLLFRVMIALIIFVAMLILGGGWLWDRYHAKRASERK